MIFSSKVLGFQPPNRNGGGAPRKVGPSPAAEPEAACLGTRGSWGSAPARGLGKSEPGWVSRYGNQTVAHF